MTAKGATDLSKNGANRTVSGAKRKARSLANCGENVELFIRRLRNIHACNHLGHNTLE